jgi:hypothetical protein
MTGRLMARLAVLVFVAFIALHWDARHSYAQDDLREGEDPRQEGHSLGGGWVELGVVAGVLVTGGTAAYATDPEFRASVNEWLGNRWDDIEGGWKTLTGWITGDDEIGSGTPSPPEPDFDVNQLNELTTHLGGSLALSRNSTQKPL